VALAARTIASLQQRKASPAVRREHEKIAYCGRGRDLLIIYRTQSPGRSATELSRETFRREGRRCVAANEPLLHSSNEISAASGQQTSATACMLQRASQTSPNLLDVLEGNAAPAPLADQSCVQQARLQQCLPFIAGHLSPRCHCK
jgi:hypothetical protein